MSSRPIVSFAERDGPVGTFGRELLDYAGILFEYWDYRRNGRLSRREVFRAWMTPVREQVEALLNRAVAAKLDALSGSCADILAHRRIVEPRRPRRRRADQQPR